MASSTWPKDQMRPRAWAVERRPDERGGDPVAPVSGPTLRTPGRRDEVPPLDGASEEPQAFVVSSVWAAAEATREGVSPMAREARLGSGCFRGRRRDGNVKPAAPPLDVCDDQLLVEHPHSVAQVLIPEGSPDQRRAAKGHGCTACAVRRGESREHAGRVTPVRDAFEPTDVLRQNE